MNILPYQVISTALLVGVVSAAVVMLASLIAMIVQWKTPKRRRHIVRILFAFVSAVGLFGTHQAYLWLVFLPALGRQQMAAWNEARAKKLAESSTVTVGDAAPSFSLTTADGDEFTLPNRGNVVVITFFATWCGPCGKELPYIEELWAAHSGDDKFRLLVIGREETTATVQHFRAENRFTFPVAADPSRDVYSLFATEFIPRTVVIAADGRIIYSKLGTHPEELKELRSLVERHLGLLKSTASPVLESDTRNSQQRTHDGNLGGSQTSLKSAR